MNKPKGFKTGRNNDVTRQPPEPPLDTTPAAVQRAVATRLDSPCGDERREYLLRELREAENSLTAIKADLLTVQVQLEAIPAADRYVRRMRDALLDYVAAHIEETERLLADNTDLHAHLYAGVSKPDAPHEGTKDSCAS
jgi:hypothetical protein